MNLQESSIESERNISGVSVKTPVNLLKQLQQKVSVQHVEDSKQLKNILKKGIEQLPQDTLVQFVTVQQIKQMIQDATAPFHQQIPKIQTDLKNHSIQIKDIYSGQKTLNIEMERLKEDLKQLREFEKVVKKMDQQLEDNKLENMVSIEKIDKSCLAMNSQVNEFKYQLEKLQDNLGMKDNQVFEAYNKLEAKQDQFCLRFDEFFQIIQKSQKATEIKVRILNSRIEQSDISYTGFHAQIMGQISDIIKNIFEKSTQDDEKFVKISESLKRMQHMDKTVTRLQKIVEDIDQRVQIQIHSNFMSKSIPILIHLNICEALDNILSPKYQQNLIDFMRKKNTELSNYCKIAGSQCVEFMNQRLKSYLKWMTENDNGCLTITWGEDIKDEMTIEELNHINQSYKLSASNRFQKLSSQKIIMKELITLLTKQEDRNDNVIIHKLSKLDPQLLSELRNQIIIHKMVNLKRYEEIDIVYGKEVLAIKNLVLNNISNNIDEKQQQQKEAIHGNALSSNSPHSQKEQVKQHALPSKIFYIKKEEMRYYHQVDRKYKQIFDDLNLDYQEFKKKYMKNLQLQTQISQSLENQIKSTKVMISEIQDQVEEFEEKQRKSNQKITQNLDVSNEKINIQLQQIIEKQEKDIIEFTNINKICQNQKDTVEVMQKQNAVKFNEITILIENLSKKHISQQEKSKEEKEEIQNLYNQKIFQFIKQIQPKIIKQESDQIEESNEDDGKQSNSQSNSEKQSHENQQSKSNIQSYEQQSPNNEKSKLSGEQENEEAFNDLKVSLDLKQQQKKKLEQARLDKNKKNLLAEQKKKEREEMQEKNRIEKEKKKEQEIQKKLEEDMIQQQIQNNMMKNIQRKVKKEQFKLAINQQSETNSLIQNIENFIQNEQQNKGSQLIQKLYKNKKKTKKQIQNSEDSNEIYQPILNNSSINKEEINELIELKAAEMKEQMIIMTNDNIQMRNKFDEISNELRNINQKQENLTQFINENNNQQLQIIKSREKNINETLIIQNSKINDIEDMLKNEFGEYKKLKMNVKQEINSLIDKFKKITDNQISDINYLKPMIKYIVEIQQYLIEDSMINQLLLEQDILDRRQIGLFGIKKNQDIMGTNQGAINNNLNLKTSQNIATGISSSTGKKIWNLDNKDKKWNEIVHSNEVKDRLQRNKDTLIDNTLDEITVNNNQNEVLTTDFGSKINQQQLYNTLKIDKNCLSCSGNALQIINQIKIACLSYINSPITYGSNSFQFTDLVQVKEMLLKKCEQQYMLLQENVKNKSNKYELEINKIVEKKHHIDEQIQIIKKKNIYINEDNYNNENVSVLSPSYIDLQDGIDHQKNIENQDKFDDKLFKYNEQENQQSIANIIDIPQKQNQIKNNIFIKEEFQTQLDQNINLQQLFPSNQPKFKIDTLQKLQIYRKKFTYGSKINKQNKNQEQQINQFDSLKIKEDLINILKIEQNQRIKQKNSQISTMNIQDKLKLRNNKLRFDDMMAQQMGRLLSDINNSDNNCQKQMQEDIYILKKRSNSRGNNRNKCRQLISPSIKSQNYLFKNQAINDETNLHVSSQGDFMVLGDKSNPPLNINDKQQEFIKTKKNQFQDIQNQFKINSQQNKIDLNERFKRKKQSYINQTNIQFQSQFSQQSTSLGGIIKNIISPNSLQQKQRAKTPANNQISIMFNNKKSFIQIL